MTYAPAKPPVVREWEVVAMMLDNGQEVNPKGARYLLAELRSRPTREEHEKLRKGLREHLELCDAAAKEEAAKLSASEAERERLRELLQRAWQLLDVIEPNADITDDIFAALAPAVAPEEGE